MKQDKYFISNNTDNPSGVLGKWDAYVNYGVQFRAEKPYSLQGNREFSTLEKAEDYVFNHPSAFPGIIITVSDDKTASKNGVYLVEHDIEGSNKNELKLTRLSKSNDTGAGSLSWGEITTGGIVIPDIKDLEIEDKPSIPFEVI